MQEYKRIEISKDQVVPIAEKMRKAGVGLVMIHGFLNEEGQMDVSWDYSVEPVVESYHVVGEMTLPSIALEMNNAKRDKTRAPKTKIAATIVKGG